MKQFVKNSNIMDFYILAILIALELLMSFSFLGYFHMEPISMTIAYIPVLLAGALLGPGASVIVGLFFGLASMWKASASYVMPADQLFSPVLSENPMGSIMLSVGSRVLFSLVIGLLYAAARRLRRPVWATALASYLAPTLHSFLVYSAMYLFFPAVGVTPLKAFDGFFTGKEVISNAAIAAVVLLVVQAFHTQVWKQLQQRLSLVQTFQSGGRNHLLPLVAMIVLTIAASLAVTVYFVSRIEYALDVRGIELTDQSYMDILHLQIQFMLGVVSLMVLVTLFLTLNRRYNAYQAYESKIDSLTGVLTRRAFFSLCDERLRSMQSQVIEPGYFIMVDLDDFKAVNDIYGHPEGDRALKEVAHLLKELCRDNGIVGRLGGDEFAAMLCQNMSRVKLEVDLRHFLEQVHKISWDDRHITCSVGVLPIWSGASVEILYRNTDEMLYAAKEAGRDRYVIGTKSPETSVSKA